MFCRECGSKNYDGDLFCESCGTRLASPRNNRSVAGENHPRNDTPMARQDSPRDNIFSEGQDRPESSQPKKQGYAFSRKTVAIVLACALALVCIYFVVTSENLLANEQDIDEQAVMEVMERRAFALATLDLELLLSTKEPRVTRFLDPVLSRWDREFAGNLRETLGNFSFLIDLAGLMGFPIDGYEMFPTIAELLLGEENIEDIVNYVLYDVQIEFNEDRTIALISKQNPLPHYMNMIKIDGEWYFKIFPSATPFGDE